MEVLQDIPLPMAESYRDVSYTSSESLDCTVGSRFLTEIEIDCLQQSMERALKRLREDNSKRKQPRKQSTSRYYMPSLEEIKEHEEKNEWSPPKVDLTSLHKERAMNEGHFRYSRSSRKRRGPKQQRTKQGN